MRLAWGSAALAVVLTGLSFTGTAAAAGSISGTVSDLADNPLAGMRVCAVTEGPFEEMDEFCTHSGTDGDYTVGPLPPDGYAVEFLPGAEGLNYVYEAWDDQPLSFMADLIEIDGDAVTGIDTQLAGGGEMTGKVLGAPSGAPVPGVEVCAEPRGLYHESGCAITNLAGEYRIAGLSTDSYLVDFFPPEEVEFLRQYYQDRPDILSGDSVQVTAGEVAPNVSAFLRQSGWISGRIFDAVSGTPLADAGACTFEVTGYNYIGECGEADESGHYTIRRVPEGTYHVRFFPSDGYTVQWYRCANGSDTALPVTVPPGAGVGEIDGALTHWFTGEPRQCEAALGILAPPAPEPEPPRCRRDFRLKPAGGTLRCVRVLWRFGRVSISAAIPLR